MSCTKPIDLKYRVKAFFVRTPDEEPFLMPTTAERLPEYVKYGEAHFKLDGKDLKPNLYQSTTPSEDEEYKDYLFYHSRILLVEMVHMVVAAFWMQESRREKR